MLNMNRLMLLIIPLIALMACAGPASRQTTLEQKLAEQNYRLGEPVERIQQYRLDGWHYLDRQHVIMQAEPSRYYLVSLRSPCHNLMTAEVIAFTTTTNQLTRFDKLLVKNGGHILEQCYIEGLHKLEKVRKELAAR